MEANKLLQPARIGIAVSFFIIASRTGAVRHCQSPLSEKLRLTALDYFRYYTELIVRRTAPRKGIILTVPKKHN